MFDVVITLLDGTIKEFKARGYRHTENGYLLAEVLADNGDLHVKTFPYANHQDADILVPADLVKKKDTKDD